MNKIPNIRFNCFLIILSIFTFKSVDAKEWTIHAGFEGLKAQKKALGSGGFWGGAGQSEVVESPSIGQHSARIWIDKGQTGYGKWGGDWKFPEKIIKGETIWYSAHIFIPHNFDYFSNGGGGRLKFMRIKTLSSVGKHQGNEDFLIGIKGWEKTLAWIFEGEQKWVFFGDKNDLFQRECWQNYQMVITFDSIPKSDGGSSEVKIYKNGIMLKNISNRKTLKEHDSYAMKALLFTYWNGGAPRNQSMFVDEITITNKTPSWQGSDGSPIVPFYNEPCRTAK